MKAVSEMTKQELSDAIMAISPKQAMEAAVQYAGMKRARYLLPDGEIMEPKDYDAALAELNATLKRWVEQDGPLHVEGIGTFKLQDRSTAMTWDCKALAENDMDTFMRLLELGCVTLDKRLADAQEKAGNVTSFRQYGHSGATTALIIDREAK